MSTQALLWFCKHPTFAPEVQGVALCNPPPNANTIDPNAPDYWERITEQEIIAWKQADLGAGWTPGEPIAPPLPVPDAVSPWQIRRALNAAGLRQQVEAAVAAADQDARDGWEYATEIRRDNILIVAMATQLGLTSEQVDGLFRDAASYQ